MYRAQWRPFYVITVIVIGALTGLLLSTLPDEALIIIGALAGWIWTILRPSGY